MEKCEYCGKEEAKATAQSPIGLTWFDNEQKWICDSCLKRKMARATMAHR